MRCGCLLLFPEIALQPKQVSRIVGGNQGADCDVVEGHRVERHRASNGYQGRRAVAKAYPHGHSRINGDGIAGLAVTHIHNARANVIPTRSNRRANSVAAWAHICERRAAIHASRLSSNLLCLGAMGLNLPAAQPLVIIVAYMVVIMIIVATADDLASALCDKRAGNVCATGRVDHDLVLGEISDCVGWRVATDICVEPAARQCFIYGICARRYGECLAIAIGIAITGRDIIQQERAQAAQLG